MLTLPLVAAVLSAGLLGGAHCIGMCGGLANMLTNAGVPGRKTIRIVPVQAIHQESKVNRWRIPTLLHAGRLFTYSLIGGFVGALGAAGLLFKPYLPVQMLMFVLGNLALIWLGLRLAGYSPEFTSLSRLASHVTSQVKLPIRFSLSAQTRRHPFFVGMAWGCMPCGLVYGVLPFSLLSGNAGSGAVLMLLFGLAALPYLLFAQGIAQLLKHHKYPFVIKGAGAALLMGIGLYGLWHYDMHGLPAIFCVTAAS